MKAYERFLEYVAVWTTSDENRTKPGMLTVIQTPTNQKRQHRCFLQYIMLRRVIRCCTIFKVR